jgi:hypothetical protein
MMRKTMRTTGRDLDSSPERYGNTWFVQIGVIAGPCTIDMIPSKE